MKHDLDGRRREEPPAKVPAPEEPLFPPNIESKPVRFILSIADAMRIATVVVLLAAIAFIVTTVIHGAGWWKTEERQLTFEPIECPEGEWLWFNTLENHWDCARDQARRQPDFTVAQLPVDCIAGRLFWVTDGVSRHDCQTGGGNMDHWCLCDSNSLIVSLD